MTLLDFKDTKKGGARKGAPKGARLGYDATNTTEVLRHASHGLQLLLARTTLKLSAADKDKLRAIIRKAKELLKK